MVYSNFEGEDLCMFSDVVCLEPGYALECLNLYLHFAQLSVLLCKGNSAVLADLIMLMQKKSGSDLTISSSD